MVWAWLHWSWASFTGTACPRASRFYFVEMKLLPKRFTQYFYFFAKDSYINFHMYNILFVKKHCEYLVLSCRRSFPAPLPAYKTSLHWHCSVHRFAWYRVGEDSRDRTCLEPPLHPCNDQSAIPSLARKKPCQSFYDTLATRLVSVLKILLVVLNISTLSLKREAAESTY